MDSSAIIEDFLYAVSSSPMFPTNLLTFPFIISYNSRTLLLKVSILLFAFINFIKSSIFPLSFSLSFWRLVNFYTSAALFRKLDATEIEETSFAIRTIWVSYGFWAVLEQFYDADDNTKLRSLYSQTIFFGSFLIFSDSLLIRNLKSPFGMGLNILELSPSLLRIAHMI